MLQPSFSKKNFFHTQGPLQFPETQAYVFRHRWGNPLSWFYPSSYTPGPAAQQFPKAHGRAGQRQSQGVTQHTEGRGGKRNWTEGKLGDLVDTAVFGDSKDLLLQFLFLNFFFFLHTSQWQKQKIPDRGNPKWAAQKSAPGSAVISLTIRLAD